MDVSIFLGNVKDRIADPRHWTRGVAARDREDNVVNPRDPSAVRWCINGSLCREYEEELDLVYRQADCLLDDTASALFHDSYVGVNDDRGHQATLLLLDRAIALELAIEQEDEHGKPG